MKADRYMFPHYKYYVREVKIKAYAQLLESYRSLTLTYMADAFGVTEDYIDSELCRFIAGGRLHAKIDKVSHQLLSMTLTFNRKAIFKVLIDREWVFK